MLLRLALAVAGLLGSPLAAYAQPAQAITRQAPTSRVIEARSFYTQGITQLDPLALIEAYQAFTALRLRGVTLQPLPPEALKMPPPSPATPPTGTSMAPSPPTLPRLEDMGQSAFQVARLLAEEDEELADLISALNPPQIAGSVSISRAELAPQTRQGWQLPLAGQSHAEIALILESGAVMWELRTTSGTPACPPVLATPEAPGFCATTPEDSDFYAIWVENHGSTPAQYVLITP